MGFGRCNRTVCQLGTSQDGCLAIEVLGPNATGNSKDTVNLMKTFARPKTGLRGLVEMVEEVVNDLDA